MGGRGGVEIGQLREVFKEYELKKEKKRNGKKEKSRKKPWVL